MKTIQVVAAVICDCFDEKSTLQNLYNLKHSYPKLINGFYNFIENYCSFADRNKLKLNNTIVFDISKKDDFCKALLSYISGMTDNFAIDIYNEIIRF